MRKLISKLLLAIAAVTRGFNSFIYRLLLKFKAAFNGLAIQKMKADGGAVVLDRGKRANGYF